MSAKKRSSLMHNLGQFFGHVARGVKSPAEGPTKKQTVRKEVHEELRETESGQKVTVRRTTIEEIELHPRDGAAPRDGSRDEDETHPPPEHPRPPDDEDAGRRG